MQTIAVTDGSRRTHSNGCRIKLTPETLSINSLDPRCPERDLALLGRSGSWEDIFEEQSGVERWTNDLADAPEQLENQVVRNSAQCVMRDRLKEFDHILPAWIERAVAALVFARGA